MACTIVSAYYPIRSKFKKEQYLSWGATFLALSSPIVLFTNEEMAPILKELRGEKPMDIIIWPMEEWKTWKEGESERWKEQYEKSPERHFANHTPELYALWAHKGHFMERAMDVNPFQTPSFFWCDFGAFRTPPPREVLERFPESNHFPSDQMLVQAMCPLPREEWKQGPDGIYGPRMIDGGWMNVRLVGGLWGGTEKACREWIAVYHDVARRYALSERYMGNDQIIMLSTVLEYPERVKVVQPTRMDIDQWFFMTYLLSSLAVYKEDTSYCALTSP